jgi:hypothetical protein
MDAVATDDAWRVPGRLDGTWGSGSSKRGADLSLDPESGSRGGSIDTGSVGLVD